MAGDATGIIVAAVIVALLGIPMWLDLIIEYVAGFAFGLFIFQSLFMKSTMGGRWHWETPSDQPEVGRKARAKPAMTPSMAS